MGRAYQVKATNSVLMIMLLVIEHVLAKSSNGPLPSDLKLHDEKDQLETVQGSMYDEHESNFRDPIPILALLEARQSSLQGYKRKSIKSPKHRRRQPHKKLSDQKSCPTQTIVSIKKTAQDIFGMTVDIHPYIIIGKMEMDQLFYETFCEVEKCKCGGMRKRYSESQCHTTYTNVYARVIKSGKAGWGFIKIRSGCACILQ